MHKQFTDTPDAPALLGTLDSSFLFAYAGAMFLSGFVAERVNLRYFLAFGMLFSGISCYLFGIARPYDIHSLWFFVFVQVITYILYILLFLNDFMKDISTSAKVKLIGYF